MLLGLRSFARSNNFKARQTVTRTSNQNMSVTYKTAGNERLRQLDTKLLCIRSPQRLSRHLLDATTKLLWDKEAVY